MTALEDDQSSAVQEIGQTVIDRIGIPKDRWEITAQLEILGHRDADARTRFGYRDLFETADQILSLFRQGKLRLVVEGENGQPHVSPLRRFLRHYLDGLMFSLPMVLQASTMLLWGYGLWGALEVDVRTGSAVALGFVASYIVTSGFAWAIVRRGLFYYYQNEGGLARWSALRMWWISVRVALALAVPALLFNLLYGFLPWQMSLIALAYYAALTVLWLNWSLIYLVRKTHWLLVAFSVAILAVLFVARTLGWSIVAANMTGLVIADVLTFGAALLGLNRWARNGAGKPTVNPPRLAVLIYTTAQVFLYGFLYAVFIFTDRVLAWTSSTAREDVPPYPFWLSPRYELGMDLALVVIVLLAGVVEYSTHSFSVTLVPGQKRVRSEDPAPFLKQFRAMYRKHSTILLVASIAAVTVAAFVRSALRDFPEPRLQEALASATTTRVFWVAAVSYAILMFALQNILILMTLSRPDLAARTIAVALLVNLAVGWTISRSIAYSGSVFGLLAGCVALAALSHRSVQRVLRELDYHYYAAY